MGKKSFSEQLREAIEACGTTRYALCRSVGVSQSALSRFMSGERGMNLATLDKLAEVLGLEIIVSVSKAPRPSPKGRKPVKGKPVITKTAKKDWTRLAYGCARVAFREDFSSRRGVYLLTTAGERGVLCLYNNNPWANHPTLRDEETAEFRKRLKSRRLKELAYASYPPEGQEDAGYSYAMLIDAGEEEMSWVAETMQEIVAKSFERMG
jgi:transcriptional regulator with XRE-family HTH domain